MFRTIKLKYLIQWVGKIMRLKFNLGVLVLPNGQLKNILTVVDWPKLQYKKYFSAHCKVSLVMKQGMKRCIHLEIPRFLSFYLGREGSKK